MTNYNDVVSNASPCTGGPGVFAGEGYRGSMEDRAEKERRHTRRGQGRRRAKRWRGVKERSGEGRGEGKGEKEGGGPGHGSASCLVNLFLFSPPGNRSYLRGPRVPPNFGFTRGVVAGRKVRRPRYLPPRFRVRPDVYPRRSHLKPLESCFRITSRSW